jgi:hypothetical protein
MPKEGQYIQETVVMEARVPESAGKTLAEKILMRNEPRRGIEH